MLTELSKIKLLEQLCCSNAVFPLLSHSTSPRFSRQSRREGLLLYSVVSDCQPVTQNYFHRFPSKPFPHLLWTPLEDPRRMRRLTRFVAESPLELPPETTRSPPLPAAVIAIPNQQ